MLEAVVRRDGPYLHITLPDVMPPDWTAIGAEVMTELEDVVERAFIEVPGHHLPPRDEAALAGLAAALRVHGALVRERRGAAA